MALSTERRVEKIQFQPGAEVQHVSNETLDSWLEANPVLFTFALNKWLDNEERSWEEVFPEHYIYALDLQARASYMANLPHNLDSDGV